MSKTIIRRINRIARASDDPRWNVAVQDLTTGFFYGDCGDGLNQVQFKEWINNQDSNTQVIIIELSCNLDRLKVVVDNHAASNMEDLEKAEISRRIDKIIKFSSELDAELAAAEIIRAKEVSEDILNSDTYQKDEDKKALGV